MFVAYYDDSKGTNVGATLAAISSVEGRVVLIAGGDAKGADLMPLRAAMQEHQPVAVIHFAAKCYVGESVEKPA